MGRLGLNIGLQRFRKGANVNLLFTSDSTFNAAENQTAIGTVTVDKEGATFEILTGIDSAKFAIDANTGVLTFVDAPDSETPTDTFDPL